MASNEATFKLMQNGNEVGVSKSSKETRAEILNEDKCVAVVDWSCAEKAQERVQQRTPSPHRDMTSGNASNSNMGVLNNANTSKLLQLNQ